MNIKLARECDMAKMPKKANGLKKGKYETGNDVQKDLDYLLGQCSNNLQNCDEQLIRKAYKWCVDAHKNTVRKSGRPFYTHPLSVALIVAEEIPLDDISVVSALLHEIIHTKNQYNINDIRSEFGPTVAEIVEAITKIQSIDKKNIEQIENYRKLLLSLFKDVRIILIQLADALHNMRTLDFLNYEKQIRYANEAMALYVPFAHRFGLGNLKLELEDLAFKYLDRKTYNHIAKRIKLSKVEREEYIDKFTEPIIKRLAKVELIKKKNIAYEVYGRAKHIFSIHNKMILREKDLDELYDLFAVRIILDTNDTGFCFLVYGILTEIYKPVPGTFKNYISSPKKNGYQSIHTAVVGPDEKYVEVQIRTKEMHKVSEKGVAAHFKYKRGFLPAQTVMDDQNMEEWMNLVRRVFENIGEDETPERLLESVRKNLYLDEIYVFTPRKEFRILPKDATPLDFAFNIHTDVGFHCIGAKVNGRVVPMDYRLQTGDQVEILTSDNQKPGKDWLNIVITQRAKYYLHKYFKDERKDSELEGINLLEKTIAQTGAPAIKEFEIEKIVNFLKMKNKEELFYKLGSRKIQDSLVLDLLKELRSNDKNELISDLYHSNGKAELKPMLKSVSKTNGANLSARFAEGMNISVVYAACCNPVPGDRITGAIDNENKLTVHRSSCDSFRESLNDGGNIIKELDWSLFHEKKFNSRIKISGKDDPKLLNDITSAILTVNNTMIKGVHIDNNSEGFEGSIALTVTSQEHLNSIMVKLLSIEGILNVERIKS